MTITIPPTLSYETLEGVSVPTDAFGTPPEGAQVQIAQFPCTLRVVHHLPEGEEFAMELGWAPDLALALATAPRWKLWLRKFTLPDAILVSAHACERCMNALAHRYGLRWGYPEHGEEWLRAGTSCRFCR